MNDNSTLIHNEITGLEFARKYLLNDVVLKKLINSIDLPPLTPSKKFFQDLIESIISQQLSVKASETIFKRFKELLPSEYTPEDVWSLSYDQMRSAGLSKAKATYVHAVAHEIVINKFDTNTVYQMSDEEVITRLTKIKGIGRWTAEMILIFSLARPDVFSMGDLGLRTAVEKLYGIERTNLKAIYELSKQWKPYRSYASRYLWKSLNNK